MENHDAYTEVPESELPGWNGTSSTEVVNTLWVFKKKRGKDGEVTERVKMASLAAKEAAMISASVDEIEIDCCRLLDA